VIRRDVIANLDFIPTGGLSGTRPDLFMHLDVGALLELVRAQYDLVLVDSPPILTLADFSGKKLRINGTELERQKMAKLGATGVGMPLSEVVPALDQGTIDGTISGLSVFVAFKMNDLLKTITVTNDTFINSIVVVSKAWLDTLPPLLTLEKLLFRLISAGFVLLTLTLISGVAFNEQLVDKAFKLDHKTVFAILSWLMFGALLTARRVSGWRGRAALRWVLASFVALLLAYVGSRFVFEVLLHRAVV